LPPEGPLHPAELRSEIAALEKERKTLHQRFNELILHDPRIQGMPTRRYGWSPTSLARD